MLMEMVKKILRETLVNDFKDNFCAKCSGGDCNSCIANSVHKSHLYCLRDDG